MFQLTRHARRYVLMLILATATLTAGSAFVMVWMQQQISRTAQNSKQLEAQLAEQTRKLRFLDERIASYHQPVVLQSRMAGVLRPSIENQVVFVEEQVLPEGRSYAIAQPYEVTTDLALLDLDVSR
jgi:hypothetical protein